MTPLEPTRFANGRAMLLAGLRRQHSFDSAEQSMAAQWQAFQQLGTLAGQQGTTVYGVMCGAAPEQRTFEYMTGVEVAAFDGLPPELGRMRIPPQHYAVFEHRGPVSALRATWEGIWHQWLPRSGRTAVHGPDFEVYGEQFDAAAGQGGIEIWFPVEPG